MKKLVWIILIIIIILVAVVGLMMLKRDAPLQNQPSVEKVSANDSFESNDAVESNDLTVTDTAVNNIDTSAFSDSLLGDLE